MNIYDYIEKYKDITFTNKDITEVDAMIFSYIAYATFEGILRRSSKMTIEEIANSHISLYTKKDKNILVVREANQLLRTLKDKKRYKDCLIYNYEFLETEHVQFCAITIEYKKNHVFVAFEGTNALISGWKEDLLLSYEFPTISHLLAIRYINKHFTLSMKQIRVGGHSKGGNLALVSSMYANKLVQKRINTIYNGDGPGLLDEEYHSKEFQSVKKKYIHFLSDHTIVGILLNHDNDTIVRSKAKNVFAHDVLNWLIEDDYFIPSQLSPFSKELDQQIANWVRETSKEQKKEVVENLEKVLIAARVKSLLDIKKNYLRVLRIIYSSKEMNSNSKKITSDFIKIVLKTLEKTKKEEFLFFWNNLLKRKKKESREE